MALLGTFLLAELSKIVSACWSLLYLLYYNTYCYYASDTDYKKIPPQEYWPCDNLPFLIAHTIPKISTVSFTWMDCSIRSNVMNVPDRPTPALQCTQIGRCSVPTRSRNALTNRTKVCGGFGTPKSGHVIKWKCLMMRCSLPRHIMNSVMAQSG